MVVNGLSIPQSRFLKSLYFKVSAGVLCISIGISTPLKQSLFPCVHSIKRTPTSLKSTSSYHICVLLLPILFNQIFSAPDLNWSTTSSTSLNASSLPVPRYSLSALRPPFIYDLYHGYFFIFSGSASLPSSCSL